MQISSPRSDDRKSFDSGSISETRVTTMIGWIVFIIGVFDLVAGAYLQMGIWIVVPISVCWYVMMLKSHARIKKEKFAKKILLERIKERCFFHCLFFSY
jgi:hypothetical protein